MDVGSEEYKILRRWIATGMQYGTATDPTIAKIVVYPNSRVLDRQARQQLAVHAHYSDGTIEDVTRRCQFETNETEVATVNESGLVQTLSITGQAGVMVRFSGQVNVFRAIVPRPGVAPNFTFAASTVVDNFTSQKWRELGIVPSEICTDEQFIRRAYLDVTGSLPAPAAVTAYVADLSVDKQIGRAHV